MYYLIFSFCESVEAVPGELRQDAVERDTFLLFVLCFGFDSDIVHLRPSTQLNTIKSSVSMTEMRPPSVYYLVSCLLSSGGITVTVFLTMMYISEVLAFTFQALRFYELVGCSFCYGHGS